MSANAKKTRQGSVVSNKMEKSVVILVERMFPHKLYGKFIRKQVRYMAHDAKNECQVGDVVLIEECRPCPEENAGWYGRSSSGQPEIIPPDHSLRHKKIEVLRGTL